MNRSSYLGVTAIKQIDSTSDEAILRSVICDLKVPSFQK